MSSITMEEKRNRNKKAKNFLENNTPLKLRFVCLDPTIETCFFCQKRFTHIGFKKLKQQHKLQDATQVANSNKKQSEFLCHSCFNKFILVKRQKILGVG